MSSSLFKEMIPGGVYYISSGNSPKTTADFTNVPKKDDLLYCLRYILRFGRFIGLFPFGGLFQSDPLQLTFRPLTFATIGSVLAAISVFVSLVIGMIGAFKVRGTNVSEWVWSSDSAGFYIVGFFSYLHFLRHGEKLLRLLRKWTAIQLNFTILDKTLSRDIVLSTLILLSGVTENLMWTYNSMFVLGKDSSILENFFQHSRTQWQNLVCYHPLVSLFILVSNKLCMWSWNLTDVFVISMARALYGRFRAFNDIVKMVMDTHDADPLLMSGDTKTKLVLLLKDHQVLRDLTIEAAKFLSPLVFLLYSGNLFFICLQIHLGISGRSSKAFWETVYALWSFVHLFTKLFITTFISAKVNEQLHKFGDFLYEMPDYLETSSVRKTREYLASKTFGLTGLGCFVITTPFMLSLLNVIFTFEIVLFQSTFPVTYGNVTGGGH